MTPPATATTGTTPTAPPTKRDRLIDAAREEIHVRGFAATTIARVAEAAGVPLGNVYYYFKTKDDLVRAVVDQHVDYVQSVLTEAEQAETPQASLLRFLELMKSNAEDVAKNGCPLGCLTQDLAKADGRFRDVSERLFERQLDWLEEQFRGCSEAQGSPRDLAIHILAATQGASTVCQAMGEPGILAQELDRVGDWIRSVT